MMTYAEPGRNANVPPIRSLWTVLLLAIIVSGCQTVPTGPSQDFVAATNALAQAESSYFDQLQAASDDSHVLLASAVYVRHAGSFASIATELTERDDLSKAKAARMAAMAQLQNYGQQIAAITSDATGTAIGDQAKATAADLTTLLTDAKAAKLTAQQAGLVQTAVNTLAQAIASAAAARDLQRLAVEARDPISQIATMIAQDTAYTATDNYASGLVADQQTAMLSILGKLYEDPSVNSSQRLAAISAWQSWKPALVSAGSDINAALGKLQKANDALAAGQTLSVGLFAQQAFAIAQQVPAKAAAKSK